MILKNLIMNILELPPDGEHTIFLYDFHSKYQNFTFSFDTSSANTGKVFIEFFGFIQEGENILLDTEPYYVKEIAKYSPNYQISLVLIPTLPKTCIKITNKMNANIRIKKAIHHYEL